MVLEEIPRDPEPRQIRWEVNKNQTKAGIMPFDAKRYQIGVDCCQENKGFTIKLIKPYEY